MDTSTQPNPQPSADSITIPVAPEPVQPPHGARPDADPRFTADDVTRARQQEKDKLYGQLSERDEKLKKLEDQLAVLASERQARLDAEQAAQKLAEDAAKKEAEAQMTAKKYVETRTSELAEQLAQIQREREAERALFEKEREYAQLREYTAQKIAAEREAIAPELLDLVSGNSPEEVDRSVELLKAKSAQIITSIQEAQTVARSQMRGVAATLPATGPMDNQPGTKTFTDAELKAMPMSEFIKHRQALLGAASNNPSQRGLYG